MSNSSSTSTSSSTPIHTYLYSNYCVGCRQSLYYNNRIIGCICIERQYCFNCLLNQRNNNTLICPACTEPINSISRIHINQSEQQCLKLSEEKYIFSNQQYIIISDSDTGTDYTENNNNNSNSNNNNPKPKPKSHCPNSIRGCKYFSFTSNTRRHYYGKKACKFHPI
jgi:hypothetical protein